MAIDNASLQNTLQVATEEVKMAIDNASLQNTLQVATEEVKMAIDNQIYTTGSDRGSEDGYR